MFKFYALILCLLTCQAIGEFFHPETPTPLYYSILRAFDPAFHLHYLLGFTRLIFAMLTCLMLIGFAWRQRMGSPYFWQWTLFLHLLFDLSGNSYNLNIYLGLYHSNMAHFLFLSTVTILLYTPSYILGYLYAFHQERFLRY